MEDYCMIDDAGDCTRYATVSDAKEHFRFYSTKEIASLRSGDVFIVHIVDGEVVNEDTLCVSPNKDGDGVLFIKALTLPEFKVIYSDKTNQKEVASFKTLQKAELYCNEQVKGYELAFGNEDDTHGWFQYHVLFRGDVVYSTEWYWE